MGRIWHRLQLRGSWAHRRHAKLGEAHSLVPPWMIWKVGVWRRSIIVGCWHPIGRHDAAAIEQQEFPSRYVGRWDLICRYDAAAIEQQEFSLHQHSNATSDDVTSHPFAVGGRV